MINFKLFNNKKILITGHTGFKGSWLAIFLHLLSGKVYGVSDKIKTKPSLYKFLFPIFKKSFFCKIEDKNQLEKIINKIQPDFIFHLAAQSLVYESYRSPYETFSANSIGTTNVLEILRKYKKKITAIFITSDKVYENLEKKTGYTEKDKIGGVDIYSSSKSCAELMINSYFKSFLEKKKNINIGVCRAGNVIGGGDWNKNRIIPDAIKNWVKKKKLVIRNPYSTRPWQHVLDPLNGYILFAKQLYLNKKFNGKIYNFGPNRKDSCSVLNLVKLMSNILLKLNFSTKKSTSKIRETNILVLNSNKAFKDFKWKPKFSFEDSVKFTCMWYKNFYKKKRVCPLKFTINQINTFVSMK